jgi:hypothetical protein
MEAAHNGHKGVVEVLIAASADVAATNDLGYGPQCTECTRPVAGCIEWCGSEAALFWAARGGHADIIEMLAAAGADRCG